MRMLRITDSLDSDNSSSEELVPLIISDPIQYKDKFCHLIGNKLTIFNSFERLGASHTINLDDIEWISTGKDLQLRWHAYKAFGWGLAPIHWAGDIGRLLPWQVDGRKAIVLKMRRG